MKSTAIILATFAFGYLLAITFRSVNALIAPNLVADVGIDAAMLGLMTSALLIAHGASQLPLGIALDRHGPRRVQAVLLCCAAAGALLFAVGNDALTLTIGRALIGVGFAGALMSGFKAVTMFMPGDRQAMGNAIVMGGGQVGFIVSTWPAEIAVELIGWRAVFAGLAAITLGAAALYFMLVPDWRAEKRQTFGNQIGGLMRVFRNPVTWRIAPLVWTTAGTQIAMVTLWAGPWYRDVAGYDRAGVATGLLVNAVSAVTGILLGGWIADRLGRRGVSLLTVMSGLLVLFILSGIPMILGLDRLSPFAWVVFAAGGQWGIIAYPWLAAFYGKDLSSRAQTGVNLGIFLFAFLLQFAVGWIIDLFPPTAAGGYEPFAYQIAFGAVFAMQVLALAWFLAGRGLIAARLAQRQSS